MLTSEEVLEIVKIHQMTADNTSDFADQVKEVQPELSDDTIALIEMVINTTLDQVLLIAESVFLNKKGLN